MLLLLLLFASLSSCQNLIDQLRQETTSAIERLGSTRVPSFEVLIEPFSEALFLAAQGGASCFSYAPYNYAFFQQLSSVSEDFSNIWPLLYRSDIIKSMVDQEIQAFPTYWEKVHPELAIAFDERSGLYSVCWKQKE